MVDALTGSPVLALFVLLLVLAVIALTVTWCARVAETRPWRQARAAGMDRDAAMDRDVDRDTGLNADRNANPWRNYTATGAHSRAWATRPAQSAPRRRARVASDMIPLVSQAVGRTAEVASARVASV
ncbi:hypothetical protein Ga0074812_13741 [Parafrankia irregularis]|uniref:Uncharacterized protein n=1 Tax=Parafrankia irregularis TaxID=795642 RepID=A0A0S4QXB1_9ACTN|nr:hypothetical protein Ga0074812_13741 [Parafrankia irregularis]